jgi:PAS domain-containing protein
LAGAIDRLIEPDQRDSARHERVAFLALPDTVIDALPDGLPDGLIVTDCDDHVILLNEKAEFMFGVTIRSHRTKCDAASGRRTD